MLYKIIILFSFEQINILFPNLVTLTIFFFMCHGILLNETIQKY